MTLPTSSPESAPAPTLPAGGFDETALAAELQRIIDAGGAAEAAACGELAKLRLRQDDVEQAMDLARRALERDSFEGGAYLTLLRARPTLALAFINTLEEKLKDPRLPEAQTPKLLAALGRALDQGGRFDQAYAQFANAAAMTAPKLDPQSDEACVVEAQEVFTPAFFAERAEHGVRGARMVFIAGLPNSGGRLIAEFLSGHPEIVDCGPRSGMIEANRALHAAVAGRGAAEPGVLRHLRAATPEEVRAAAERYLAEIGALPGAADAAFRVDWGPANFAQLGLIKLMFPDAKIIVARRFLLDVALSAVFDGVEEPPLFANSLDMFAHRAILYMELMRHWESVLSDEILAVQYERMVDEPGLYGSVALTHLGAHLPAEGLPAPRAGAYERWSDRWRDYRGPLTPAIESIMRYESIRGVPVVRATTEGAAYDA